jgi:hypothetical protein
MQLGGALESLSGEPSRVKWLQKIGWRMQTEKSMFASWKMKADPADGISERVVGTRAGADEPAWQRGGLAGRREG